MRYTPFALFVYETNLHLCIVLSRNCLLVSITASHFVSVPVS